VRKFLFLPLIVVASSGCATINKQSVNPKAVSDFKNQTIVQTARKVPDFAAMTADNVRWEKAVVFAMISEGNSIVASNKVADPADSIAAGLAAALSNAHGIRVISPPVSVSSDDVDQVAEVSIGTARFVLDVQTINWGFGTFTSDWTHYRVIYTAKARLIDSQSKSVVAEGFCKRIPESKKNAPTYDELLENGAALLKSELSLAAEECVKSLKSEMLSL
jgi:hypothetical protein